MKIERADAVRWLTINPARALGIDKVTGSLEPGKNADVVIWSGDPFSVYAKAERVFIDGALTSTTAPTRDSPQRDFMTGLESRPDPDSSIRIEVRVSWRVRRRSSLAPKQPSMLAVRRISRGLGSGPAVKSRPDPVAVTNARIFTVSGAVIEKGTVVIAGGKIAAVGANVRVPAGATVIDAANKIITPGMDRVGHQHRHRRNRHCRRRDGGSEPRPRRT